MDREERERCWYFSQLEALSQRMAQLPRIEMVSAHTQTHTHARTHTQTCCGSILDLSVCVQFSLQMDLIRQQLEFEAQQVQSAMKQRFGTNDEMVQRTQVSLSGCFPYPANICLL